MDINKYLKDLYNALGVYNSNNKGYGEYEGKNGAIKLARNVGHAFYDFSEKEVEKVIGSTYSTICVRYYNLKPPIDAKDWVKYIYKGIEERRK